MNCKQCINHPIWNQFFPKKLLVICNNCNEIGIKHKKVYKYGAYLSLGIYFSAILTVVSYYLFN